MKLALREEMSRGRTLAERLSWLDGIELTTSVDVPPGELGKIFADSPVGAANVPGSGALLDPDPAERAAAKDLMRGRLELAATLGAEGVLTVPQFGSAPGLPDLSPYRSADELERELFAEQLEELAPVARNAGVPIFLEPLNRYEQHLVNRLEQGVEFAERAGGGVGIWLISST
jgi:sugar phosphate isomerase/epimerase